MIPFPPTADDPSDESTDETYYVLGDDDDVGIAIARRLRAAGRDVTVVHESYEPSDVPGFAGDPSAADDLARSGIDAASTVIVATRSDRRNLLLAQVVSTRYDTPRVVVLVNEPDRLSLFEAAGHEPICVTTTLSAAISEAV